LTQKELNFRRLLKLIFLFFVPFILILIQPSLGVAVLTSVGFLGVLLASSIEKKYFLVGILVFLLTVPGLWFILQPYQKTRIVTFLNPENDPQGAGYNSIQSMISVGSGKLFGRGLGEGVQTQLEFLPEKHTDFIFAAISEELGFMGSSLVLLGLFAVFLVLIHIIGHAVDPVARAYVSGVFLVLFAQTIVHVGMNMGLFPITGIPLPFVSAGGSALLGTTIAIAIVMKAKK
jgi:rod shape determining protein RodA